MVGQHMHFGLLLKDVEIVAAEAVVPGIIGRHAGDCRKNRGGLEGVFKHRVRRGGSRKDNLDETNRSAPAS